MSTSLYFCEDTEETSFSQLPCVFLCQNVTCWTLNINFQMGQKSLEWRIKLRRRKTDPHQEDTTECFEKSSIWLNQWTIKQPFTTLEQTTLWYFQQKNVCSKTLKPYLFFYLTIASCHLNTSHGFIHHRILKLSRCDTHNLISVHVELAWLWLFYIVHVSHRGE